VHPNPVEEMVADKGYHSNETMTDFAEPLVFLRC